MHPTETSACFRIHFFGPLFISFCQKCDRQQPCGLCRSRGVEHLCRWELEPFARPTPARPPAIQQTARQGTPSDQVVNGASTSGATASAPASVSPSLVTTPIAAELVGSPQNAVVHGGPVDHDVKEAAITLAQLSVARHVGGQCLDDNDGLTCLYRASIWAQGRSFVHYIECVFFHFRGYCYLLTSCQFTSLTIR